MSGGQAADSASAADHLRWINQSFYRAEPIDYILLRISSLLKMVGHPDDHVASVREGLIAHGVMIKFAEFELTSEDLSRHAMIESTLIAHHAVETMLRLFVAHCGLPACPPIRVASHRTPREFKAIVREIVDNKDPAELRCDFGEVFMGLPDAAAEESITRRDASVSLLRELAEMWLNDAAVYNALKHGLAGIVGEAQIAIEGRVMSSGPSLEYLESSGSRKKPPISWSSTTVWIQPQAMLSAAMLAAHLINNLWLVAKCRYVGGEPPKTLFDAAGVHLREASGDVSPVRRFSMTRVEEAP